MIGIRLFIMICWLICFIDTLPAQSESPSSATGQAALLKKGFLIVRLPSYDKQEKYYNAIIGDSLSGKKERERAQAQLHALTTRRDGLIRVLRHTIDSVYRFSEVRYISQRDFNSPDKDSINQSFLTPETIKDPSLSIGDRPYMVLAYMDRTSEAGTNMLNLRLLLADGNEANQAIQFPGVGNIINILLDNGKFDAAEKLLLKRMMKFQNRLQKQYANSVK
ncbi:MAG: hypothetical protein UZ08_BCD001001666 [Candidatus Parvibacillus calidus]|nr:MAG: hypothetical protein UZ08_BCD001001666 [Candidatus Parvibacillus calidus]